MASPALAQTRESRAVKKITDDYKNRNVKFEAKDYSEPDRRVRLHATDFKFYDQAKFDAHQLIVYGTSNFHLNNAIATIKPSSKKIPGLANLPSKIESAGQINLFNNATLNADQLILSNDFDKLNPKSITKLTSKQSNINIPSIRFDYAIVSLQDASNIKSKNTFFNGGIKSYALQLPSLTISTESTWENDSLFVIGSEISDSYYRSPQVTINHNGTLKTNTLITRSLNLEHPLLTLSNGTLITNELYTSKNAFKFESGKLVINNTFHSPDGFDFNHKQVIINSSNMFMQLGKIHNARNVFVKLGTDSVVVHSKDFNPNLFGSYHNKGLNHILGTPFIIPKDRHIKLHGRITDSVKIFGFCEADPKLKLDIQNKISITGSGQLLAPNLNHYSPLEVVGGKATINNITTNNLRVTSGGSLSCNNITLLSPDALNVRQGKLQFNNTNLYCRDISYAFNFRNVEITLAGSLNLRNKTSFLQGSTIFIAPDTTPNFDRFYQTPIITSQDPVILAGRLKVKGRISKDKPLILCEAPTIDLTKLKYDRKLYSLQQQPYKNYQRAYLTYSRSMIVKPRVVDFD